MCFGDTPLHQAVFYGYTDIVKILVPMTDFHHPRNNYGRTPNVLGNNVWAYGNCGNLDDHPLETY